LVLKGFDSLTEPDTISLSAHHTVECIELPAIERLDNLWIGECDWGNTSLPEPPGSLMSLGNFESLEYLELISINGNASLTDASAFDRLIANGAAPPTHASLIGHVSLPSAEIIAKLDVLGADDYYFCGNLGEERCTCPID
jgi:hypothetical protein